MIFQNIEFHNVAEIEPFDAGWRLWRVPASVRAMANERLRETTAAYSTGIELRFRLPHNFGLAVFCDAAEVVLDIDDLAADALQIAVGLGVSYRTILGPVRLDFGYRVRAPPLQVEVVGDLGEVALVGLRRFSLLLSLGEAF